MGAFFEVIPPSQVDWLKAQKVFWVSTAPLSGKGHCNVSPKGGPYFGVLDDKTFWYLDLTGSGNETISHLHEPGNGRITILFNGFEGPPKILRLWGHGRVLEMETKEFDDFVSKHGIEAIPGSRSIIIVDIHQVGTSCGYSVPFYDFKAFRPVLNDHFRKKRERFLAGKEDESMDRYWATKSAWSMDGLPGMKRGLAVGKRDKVAPIKKMVGPWAPKRYRRTFYTMQDVILVGLLCLLAGILGATLGPRLFEDVRVLIPVDFRVPSPFPSLAEWK